MLAAVGCIALALGALYAATSQRRSVASAAAGALQGATIATAPAVPETSEPPSPPPVVAVAITPAEPKPASKVSLSSKPARAAKDGKLVRAEALIQEGTTLFNQKQFGLAESSLLQALKIIPEHPKALAALVRVHLARSDGAEAVRWAKRLLARYPKNDAYLVLLGDAYAMSGNQEAARKAWSEAARGGNGAARRRLQ